MTPTRPYSYLSNLHCSRCHQIYDASQVQTFCQECRAPLLANYNLESAKNDLDRDAFRGRQRGMWRWHELLPLEEQENIVTLGEGDAPLLLLPRLGAELGLPRLYLKDESSNPTGSFKARGLAAAVSKAKELGIGRVVIPTAGNAGGAMAAYAARSGMEALVYMPADAPIVNRIECEVAGAGVCLVDGLISDAAVRAAEKAVQGWFDVSTFKEPYRVEGKKIMGYELAEAFSWRAPEVIVYPTGGGTGLVGMWKAFNELRSLGWLEGNSLPRMVSIQAAGCAPVVRAFESGADACEFWEGASTIAAGLRVPKSFADRLILSSLRESQGIALSVSDDAIREAQQQLGVLEGIFAAPEGAATIAGLAQLVKQGWVRPEERVVVFNTALGLKYLS